MLLKQELMWKERGKEEAHERGMNVPIQSLVLIC